MALKKAGGKAQPGCSKWGLFRGHAGATGCFGHGAPMSHETSLVVLFVASLLAGARSALAGGLFLRPI